MNKDYTYQTFIKSTVYLLLICQLTVTVVPHCMSMFDNESELIELSSSEDNESELKDKKEKEDKLNSDIELLQFEDSKICFRIFHNKDLISLHHPENRTPPPKFLRSKKS